MSNTRDDYPLNNGHSQQTHDEPEPSGYYPHHLTPGSDGPFIEPQHADEARAEAEQYVAERRREYENAPPKPQPKPLDLATLRKRRARREDVFPFTLIHTTDDDGNPTIVKAKMPNIFDVDGLADLPAHLRGEIVRLIEVVEGMEKEGKPVEEMDTRTAVENFGSIAHMADAYVISGFVEPRVYATPEEADKQGGAWVRDIESADRMAFFHYCTNREGRGVADVKTFRSGSVSHVGDGSVDSPVSRPDQSQPPTENQ